MRDNEHNLIWESYQQVNEIGGGGFNPSGRPEDIGTETYDNPDDPAFNPTGESEKSQAIAALKLRLRMLKGQHPPVIVNDIRQVVDSMVHMANVVHPAEAEHILKTQVRDVAGFGGKIDAEGRQTTPLFTPEQIQTILTPLPDKHEDGSDRLRYAWTPHNS